MRLAAPGSRNASAEFAAIKDAAAVSGTDRRVCWLAGCLLLGIAVTGCAVDHWSWSSRSSNHGHTVGSHTAIRPGNREFAARGPLPRDHRHGAVQELLTDDRGGEPPFDDDEPPFQQTVVRAPTSGRDRNVRTWASGLRNDRGTSRRGGTSRTDDDEFDDESDVRLASSEEPPPAPASDDEPARLLDRRGSESHALRSADDQPAATTIDLASALQRVGGQNPQVQLARERIAEACAQQDRAEALWLPSIRAGANWNRHTGRIQDVVGNVFDTNRSSYYTGFGANAVGAGSPAVPGVAANFHLADALHQPAAAEHATAARQFGANATEQDVILQTSLAYLDLLRSHQELAIAREIEQLARDLTELTKSYADTGQGLRADHDRARTELSVRRNDTMRAREATQIASTRLATLLRLDPATPLQPAEAVVTAWSLTNADTSVRQLIADGLSHRPEVCESRSLVAEACERLQRERHAPLLPSVLLSASYGGNSGGTSNNLPSLKDRFDADAVAYWELRNLGFGEKAARAEAASRVEQAKWREIALLDRIAREVVEAHVQVTSRREQVAVAEEGIEAAQNSFDRNLERIKNAQGLPLESLQSLQALATAKREYLRVLHDFNAAQIALQRAVGWSEN